MFALRLHSRPLPQWATRLKWALLVILAALFIADRALPPPMQAAYQTSLRVSDRHNQWLGAFPVEDGKWRLKADLSEIDPKFIQRLLLIEDKRFFDHSGIDGLAILRAARSWKRAGRPLSGASTITMQLVRQLEPRPRTLKSKAVEALRALQLETRLSKREILQLYLTHAPYGGNIEGVTSASYLYFDKAPSQLTDAQIALLIALPQSPEARRPDRRPKTAKAARDHILDKLQALNAIDPQHAKEAKSDPVSSRRVHFKQIASTIGPRFRTLASRTTHAVHSSLDKSIQIQIERLARQATPDKDHNLSIIVVENRTMAVRAALGSAGRDRPGGWIDMTSKIRSPGSTLKPVIYGLAFDDGLSAPSSLVLDAPTRFGTYQPENFNRRYHGNVKVYEALSHSLNVPAVIALEKVGTKRFQAALKLGGLHLKQPSLFDGEQNLALALGGAGMRAEDLAMLYAGLANDGVIRPLHWIEGQSSAKSYALMQKDSARKITEILRQAPSPGGRVPHWLTQQSAQIAYKTGTSYGFRDAWAVGYSDAWTVVVWAGRPDGAPRVGKTGRDAAAPLMFQVFDILPAARDDAPYHKIADAPAGLKTIGGAIVPAPQIIFPSDGVEIALTQFGEQARGLSLAARSPTNTPLNWYVDGNPIRAARWKPKTQGFYRVSVVDANGYENAARVRIVEMN